MYKIPSRSKAALYALKVIRSCERIDHLDKCWDWIFTGPFFHLCDILSLCSEIEFQKAKINKKEKENEERTDSTS